MLTTPRLAATGSTGVGREAAGRMRPIAEMTRPDLLLIPNGGGRLVPECSKALGASATQVMAIQPGQTLEV